MDIAKLQRFSALRSAAPDGEIARSWLIGLVPGGLLIMLLALPLSGAEFPGRIGSLSTHDLLAITLAVLSAISYLVFWHRGYRLGELCASEHAALVVDKAQRELLKARCREQRCSREREEALGCSQRLQSELHSCSQRARRHAALAYAAIECTGEALIFADSQGQIRAISAAAAQLTGVHRNDAIGAPLSELVARLYMRDVRATALTVRDAEAEVVGSLHTLRTESGDGVQLDQAAIVQTLESPAFRGQSMIAAEADNAESHGPSKQAVERRSGTLRAGGNPLYSCQPVKPLTSDCEDDGDWMAWLKHGLQAGLGHLLSQEIIACDTQVHLPQVECYLRLEDADGFWISPREYLPALRRSGETEVVDLWMLEQLLEQLRRRPELLVRYDCFSINAASESVTDPRFAKRAAELIRNAGVDARNICFEVTEDAANGAVAELGEFVSAMRKLGVRIAVDQCLGPRLGQMLQRDRPDFIKISPALLRDDGDDPLADIRSVVDAARESGALTVACGIENADLVVALRRAGVDYLQGTAINKIGPLII